MNRSLLYHAFGVRKGYDYVRTVYGAGCIRFVLAARQELLVCPRCHGTWGTEAQRWSATPVRPRPERVGRRLPEDGWSAIGFTGVAAVEIGHAVVPPA